MRLCILFVLGSILTHHGLTAQEEPIYLTNPSFEDMPRHSKPPRGWYDCGFEGESPPDVQPSGTFSVTKGAFDGETYLGMVVRDNDTWEAVSQRLSRPLEKGKCYEFSLHLSRSELYVSTSRITDETANYTTPAKMRIYGGTGYCDKQYLLAETEVIANTGWREYRFRFEPIANYSYLVLEVFYKTPTLFPYNGNVLIDNASPITPIPCDEELISRQEVRPEPEDQPENQAPVTAEVERAPPPQQEPRGEPTPPAPIAPPPAAEEVSFSELKRSELREGQTIRIDKLFFEVDKSIIAEDSYQVLNEVFNFLQKNQDLIIEIGGHTNGLCSDSYCEKLSSERARAVAVYLAQRGISWDRLQYKGYGKRNPIASNDTAEGRKRNQRVEVKILSFNG